MTDSEIGDQLAGWGKVAVIGTTGRVSGRPARAAVGYVAEPDGSLLVAAGDPEADWARNLEADPRCTVRIGDQSWACAAELLDGPARSAAIVELIVRYGTPAERLGNGPAFRLRRLG